MYQFLSTLCLRLSLHGLVLAQALWGHRTWIEQRRRSGIRLWYAEFDGPEELRVSAGVFREKAKRDPVFGIVAVKRTRLTAVRTRPAERNEAAAELRLLRVGRRRYAWADATADPEGRRRRRRAGK